MKLGIIVEFNNGHLPYVEACKELNVEYEIIDIISSGWIDNIKNTDCDGFLIRPSWSSDVKKRMYDEKLYFINKVLGKPIYPSYEEIFLYENKRNMAYWLECNDIPMPKTWVFYNKSEALQFIDSYEDFPLVFKPNIGSAALGIQFIDNKRTAYKLVNRMFTKWKFYNRGYTKWKKSKYGPKYPLMDDKQYNNIMFQERIKVKHEWRGVKIGDSYFAHKKLPDNRGLHSGSGRADYSNPPLKVMDFIKYVCDMGSFNSMNVDFFEDVNGNFYVNELQTVFGSKIKPYQMCVDGKPGRYVLVNGNWFFEEGVFNNNESNNLRVQHFIEKLRKLKEN